MHNAVNNVLRRVFQLPTTASVTERLRKTLATTLLSKAVQSLYSGLRGIGQVLIFCILVDRDGNNVYKDTKKIE